MRIVFLGTPDLAAYCLDFLLRSGCNIVGVVTAPDRPAGRGRKFQSPPVKRLALDRGLAVLQPESLKSAGFLEQLKSLRPDLQVVIAFRMLPEAVWTLPPLGTFNMHASYLPEYRGAAPVNWVIINGEKETGVTTFFLDHAIDTGRIIFRKRIPIAGGETTGSLMRKIMPEAAAITLKTIEAIASAQVKAVTQSEYITPGSVLKKAPKIYREDCRIDWSKTCREVVNLIRGLNPQPGAFCDITEENDTVLPVKIYEADCMEVDHDFLPGTLFSDNKQTIMFATPDGFVNVKQLQLPGKKIMDTAGLLRGFKFRNASIFNENG